MIFYLSKFLTPFNLHLHHPWTSAGLQYLHPPQVWFSRHELFFPLMHQYHIHHTNSILFPINGIGTPTQHSKLISIHGNTIPKFILCSYCARKKTKSVARFFYIFLPFSGVPVKIY